GRPRSRQHRCPHFSSRKILLEVQAPTAMASRRLSSRKLNPICSPFAGVSSGWVGAACPCSRRGGGRRRKSRLLKCAVENFPELSGGAGSVHKLAIDEHGWRATHVQGHAFVHPFLPGPVIRGLRSSLQAALG